MMVLLLLFFDEREVVHILGRCSAFYVQLCVVSVSGCVIVSSWIGMIVNTVTGVLVTTLRFVDIFWCCDIGDVRVWAGRLTSKLSENARIYVAIIIIPLKNNSYFLPVSNNIYSSV